MAEKAAQERAIAEARAKAAKKSGGKEKGLSLGNLLSIGAVGSAAFLIAEKDDKKEQ